MRRGFTIVELMIVVSIVGIVCAIFLGALMSIRDRQHRGACVSWGQPYHPDGDRSVLKMRCVQYEDGSR